MKINKKLLIAASVIAPSILFCAADDFPLAILNAQKLAASPGLQYITVDDICPRDDLTRLLNRVEHLSCRNATLVAELSSLCARKQTLETEAAAALEKKAAILRLLGVQPSAELPPCSSHEQVPNAGMPSPVVFLEDEVTTSGTSNAKVTIRIERNIFERVRNATFNQAMTYLNNDEYDNAIRLFAEIAANESESDVVRAHSCASLGTIYKQMSGMNLADKKKALACFEDALDFCNQSDAPLREIIEKNIQELEELITKLEELPPLAEVSSSSTLQDDEPAEEHVEASVVSDRSKRVAPSAGRSVRKGSKAKRVRNIQLDDPARRFCTGCSHQFSTVSNYNLHIKRFPFHKNISLLLPPPSISPSRSSPVGCETESSDSE